MLLLGCTGKSAQIPLYVWLPDAMAGPTPVSALIHAATMVTAGVYLICRLSFVFVLSPAVMTIIAFTGALTALFAAMIALVQNDIKKVLAFSTVSTRMHMVATAMTSPAPTMATTNISRATSASSPIRSIRRTCATWAASARSCR